MSALTLESDEFGALTIDGDINDWDFSTLQFNQDGQTIAPDKVYGLFATESLLGRDMYWEQAVVNDIVWGRTRSFNTLATMHYTGDESPLRGLFSYGYFRVLKACNDQIRVLTYWDNNGGLTDLERRYLGEYHFLRAYIHFLLAYHYGTPELGVPFTAYEEGGSVNPNGIPDQLASVTDNYEWIIRDLLKAEDLLPLVESYIDKDKGRASKQSAVAVMAKAYAYWATWDKTQWNNVISCVNKLESDYGRGLVDSYTDLFSPDISKFWSIEHCWGYPAYGNRQPGLGNEAIEFPGICLEDKGWTLFNGWGQFKPTCDIYEELLKDGENNIRLVSSILEYGQSFLYFGSTRRYYSTTNLESGFQINKYMQAFEPMNAVGTSVNDNPDWPYTSINWPIIRFADCLLLRAEAYLATGDAAKAAQDINRIRRRSLLNEIGATATWTDLYHERRCELVFEMSNDHAYDCKRWAFSGVDEIKQLALNELNTHPRVRFYDDRGNPDSDYSVGPYADYKSPAKSWENKYMTFPYPSEYIANSEGHLNNPPTWR